MISLRSSLPPLTRGGLESALCTFVFFVGRERPQAPCMRATERSEALSESLWLAPAVLHRTFVFSVGRGLVSRR